MADHAPFIDNDVSSSNRVTAEWLNDVNDFIYEDLPASTGSGLVGFIQSGTGATARTAQGKLREGVSVLDFGAVGDGVTDDTAAIQAAITYCQNNLKALYFPGNNPSAFYKVTSTLIVTKPLKIIGDGSNASTLWNTALTAGQYVLDIDGTAMGTFENCQVEGITLRAGSGDGLRIKNVSKSIFRDIGIRDAVTGIVYTGTRCFSNEFEKLFNVSGISGTFFLMDSHTGGGQHSFNNCSFGGTTGFSATNTTVTDNVSFVNTNFEQCVSYGVNIAGTVDGLTFFGCRAEGGNAADLNIRPDTSKEVKGLVISGCTFSASDSGGTTRIILGGSAGTVRGFAITGNVVTHGSNNFSAAFVTLNGDGESGTITGNFLNGTTAGGAAIVSAARTGVLIYGNENLTGKMTDYGSGNAIATSFWNCIEGSLSLTDSSGAGLTFTANTGHYTRVGRMVFWQATFTYPATADASATKISGLPFAPLNNGAAGRSGAMVHLHGAAFDIGVLQGVTGSTDFKFYNRQTGAAITNANLSGKSIYVSGFYAV